MRCMRKGWLRPALTILVYIDKQLGLLNRTLPRCW